MQRQRGFIFQSTIQRPTSIVLFECVCVWLCAYQCLLMSQHVCVCFEFQSAIDGWRWWRTGFDDLTLEGIPSFWRYSPHKYILQSLAVWAWTISSQADRLTWIRGTDISRVRCALFHSRNICDRSHPNPFIFDIIGGQYKHAFFISIIHSTTQRSSNIDIYLYCKQFAQRNQMQTHSIVSYVRCVSLVRDVFPISRCEHLILATIIIIYRRHYRMVVDWFPHMMGNNNRLATDRQT